MGLGEKQWLPIRVEVQRTSAHWTEAAPCGRGLSWGNTGENRQAAGRGDGRNGAGMQAVQG